MVQAAPAGNFLAFNPAAFDLILVGTRNGSAPNALKALDVHTGNPAWSFVNSSLQGGDDKDIGIISSGASIDYLNHLVYFASRERSGGSNKTLWCVNFDGVSANLVWASALGNIDGSPILFNGRIYVGTNAGIVHALDAVNGDPKWSLPLGDGAVKGFLFPQFGSSNLIASTTNKVWSIADNVGSGAVNPDWPVTVIPFPSIPLYVPGTMKVVVGSGNGNLYQMDAVTPLPVTSVVLGDGGAAVGAPAMDVLKSMIYVGTDAGVIYGVVFPLP
jgi:outer membrane protein assembly factor BamB